MIWVLKQKCKMCQEGFDTEKNQLALVDICILWMFYFALSAHTQSYAVKNSKYQTRSVFILSMY